MNQRRHPASALRLLSCMLIACTSTALHAEAFSDPTRPATLHALVSAATAPTTLHVEAILYGPQRRLAIVDGKVVRVGDRILNAVIEAITDHSVCYVRAGHREVAYLARTTLQVRRTAVLQATLRDSLPERQP